MLLDRSENFRGAGNEFVRCHELLLFHWLIAPAQLHRIFFQIARTELNSNRDTLLDPFPIATSATEFTSIDFHLEADIGVFICAKLSRKFVASFQYLAPRFFLRRDR